jgi:hypothetical protein
MRVRNWCVRWACESGTGACTEHTHQVLMRAQSAFPSKNAEHTHQELMRTLSIWVRNWCVCSACASVPDAYAQHAHKFLTRMLGISIKIPNLKEVPTNHAEHTRKELERMPKVPKWEIFDRSDFPDFYTIKSSWVGDFVVKILTYYFNFWGS